MATGRKIEILHRQATIGDLRHLVELFWLDLTAPEMGGNYDASLTKTNVKKVWAAINTLDKVEFFNQGNIERQVTHHIIIRWFPTFQFNSSQYRLRTKRISVANTSDYEWYEIINSEDCDRRREFILLKCCIRGQEIDIPVNVPKEGIKFDELYTG